MTTRIWMAQSRRRFLGTAARTVVAGAILGANPGWLGAASAAPLERTSIADALRPPIRRRSEWAGGPPPPPLEAEAPGDVRFLLVHHSASANEYRPDDIPGILRSFHQMHTSAEKGWPDVAYNFFVDRFGVIWEGRAGSLDAPIKGDATGGSQGFAQLCCLVGNFHEAAPTSEMLASTHRLLAWLAVRYGIDPTPGATTSFVSRGSNRWPAGSQVTARTISGHRDMSQTLCPGDFLYPRLEAEIPLAVTALVDAAIAVTATTTSSTTSVAPAPAPSSASAGPTSTRRPNRPSTPVGTGPPNTVAGPAVAGHTDHPDAPGVSGSMVGGATAALVGVATALRLRDRRRRT